MGTPYEKGRRKEYKLKHMYESKGYLCIRSAGSKSPFDLVVIDKENKRIRFVQSKSVSFSANKKKVLEKEYEWLNDEFICSFLVE